MGRGAVRDSRAMGAAEGRAWTAFRRQLFAQWGARGPVRCFACGHPVGGPDLAEVEHRISRSKRPELSWTPFWAGEAFLVPVHGGGRKSCGHCGLDCNAVIGSNVARRDELGRSVPLTPAEIAAAQQRAQGRPRSSTGRDRRAAAGKQPAAPETARNPRPLKASAGRDWLTRKPALSFAVC